MGNTEKNKEEVDMRISFVNSGVVHVENPRQGLQDYLKAGVSNLFLDYCCYISPLDMQRFEKRLNPKEVESDLSLIEDYIKTIPMQVPIVRLPFLQHDTKRLDATDLLLKYCKEFVIRAEKMGAKQIIAQPLSVGVSGEDFWEINRNYYMSLLQECTCKETTILLTNDVKFFENRTFRGLCSDADEAKRWVDQLNELAKQEGFGENRFGFCMDVGRYTVCGINMQDVAVELGHRIKAVMISDNNGHDDQCKLPLSGYGYVDLLSLIRGLRSIRFDGELIMQIGGTTGECKIMLKPTILKYAKEVADFIKWQIELETSLYKYKHIVLFGAGNMCRNYMKCYSEKFPPLFTCDNNPNSWGTIFEGLEVKNPEVLRDLPENTGVYICNMYYREIQAQLKEMGVKNIEFFNDEFLPAYHVDRIGRLKDKE